MPNITPLFLMNTTITAEAGRIYQFVDIQGNPLTNLTLERRGDSLIVRSENGTEMEIKEYEKAEYVPPQAQTADKGYLWLNQHKHSNEPTTAKEVEHPDGLTKFAWLALGGAALLGTGAALVSRSGKKSTEAHTNVQSTNEVADKIITPKPTTPVIIPEPEKADNSSNKNSNPPHIVRDNIQPPTLRITEVANDNVLSTPELSQSVKVKVEVSDLEQGASGQLILKNGNTILGTLNVAENKTYEFILQGEMLKQQNGLTARLSVSNPLGNTAVSKIANGSYALDFISDQPSITLDTLAGVAITNGTLGKILSSREITADNVPLVLQLSGLEAGGLATVKVDISGKEILTTVTENGEVTINLPKADLIAATTLSVSATAQDRHLNPEATSTPAELSYTVDLITNKPDVKILSIGGEERYQLYAHQINTTDIPIKLQINGMDTDASGQLNLKIGNQTVMTEQSISNGEMTLYLSAEQLRQGNEIKAEVVATDNNGNSAKSDEANRPYEVENFIRIKQIDTDFNISYTDTRQAGVLLSGEVRLNAQLQPGFTQLQPNLNQGDVWRWADSVTFTFENGTAYTVPVTHNDPDDNRFTADPNSVEYALSLTATQWKEMSDKAFNITVNRLKDRNSNDFETVFYLSDAENNGIFKENASKDGKSIQKLDIQVIPNHSNDVSDSGNPDYPYKLTKYEPKTIITGVAGGSDVAVGDVVNIQVGNNTTSYTVKLDENKSFKIEVPSEELLNNPTASVTASLTTASQAVVKPAVSSYMSPAMVETTDIAASDEGVHTSEQTNWDELPYFMKALLNGESLLSGFLNNKASGTPIEIRFSFADPNNSKTVEYLNSINLLRQPEFRYEPTALQPYSEENKNVVREALKKISDKTLITFKEETETLAYGQGMNFFILPFNNALTPGFAVEGESVYLNSRIFQQTEPGETSISPKNQGITTVLHEVMHVLGMKHPFVNDASDPNHNDHYHLDVGGIHSQNILSKAENRSMLTLMSYEADINEYADLRIFDLATLHYRYGVNKTIRPEDNVYTFKNFNPKALDGDIYIWDGAGNDTFNAENVENDEHKGVYINLKPGSWIHIGEKEHTLVSEDYHELSTSDYFNDTAFPHTSDSYLYDVFNRFYPSYSFNQGQAFIGYGTLIENAVGSKYDDTLIGNDANNLLEGGAGKDRLEGGKGNDVLNGGEGADVMIGGDGNDVYFIDNQEDTITEQQIGGQDTLYSTVNYIMPQYVEIGRLLGTEDLTLEAPQVESTSFSLHGNSGNNLLIAGSTHTDLYGYGGSDTFVINKSRTGIDTHLPHKIYDFEENDKIQIAKAIYQGISLDKLSIEQSVNTANPILKYHSEDGDFSTLFEFVSSTGEALKLNINTHIEII